MRTSPSSPVSPTAVSPGDGCLSFYLLTPVTVVCVGLLLAFLVLGTSGPAALVAQAEGLEAPSAAGAIHGVISPVFSPEVQFWASRLQDWTQAAGVDPNLAATVMQIESCGDPRALSRSGAIGLFQVMPYHFLATDNPYQPGTNALRGLDYLSRSMAAASGDPRLALAGYNGGIGVIPRSESTWSSQTQRYAYWGSGIYSDALSGAQSSPRLQEWLEAGGRSLCAQAAARLGITP